MTSLAPSMLTLAGPGRVRRVRLLLAIFAVLSLADLVVTIGFMRTMGMYEDNPIVVALVELTGSTASIAIYKTLSVLVCAGLLYRLRRHWQAEVGAWVAACILAGVVMQWCLYAESISEIDPAMMMQLAASDPGWVVIP